MYYFTFPPWKSRKKLIDSLDHVVKTDPWLIYCNRKSSEFLCIYFLYYNKTICRNAYLAPKNQTYLQKIIKINKWIINDRGVLAHTGDRVRVQIHWYTCDASISNLSPEGVVRYTLTRPLVRDWSSRFFSPCSSFDYSPLILLPFIPSPLFMSLDMRLCGSFVSS